MTVRVAINGFGRIGRATAKIMMDRPDMELVAVNDLTDTVTLAHLLKYDSFFGVYNKNVSHTEDSILIDDKKIALFKEKDPSLLPWGKLNIDVVLECTGKFTKSVDAEAHIKAGAKKVIISAPAKDDTHTYAMGVNNLEYKGEEIISNASCTTNCMAPITKVIEDTYGITNAMMTTTHSYTSSQNIVDGPNKDLRRARTAGLSMIPTTTGAATAVAKVIPTLEGKMTGMSIRVPTANVSLLDVTYLLEKAPGSLDEVKKLFVDASDGAMKGIIETTEIPLVSIDFKANSNSAIVDLPLMQLSGNMLKIFAWYDNEWGYSTRLVDMAEYIGLKKIFLL